jgi:hypothetical protein
VRRRTGSIFRIYDKRFTLPCRAKPDPVTFFSRYTHIDERCIMTRMLSPHTTCPGCRAEVYLDELVKGRCPLCGCTLEDFEEPVQDMEELIERCDFSWLVFNYFVFKRFDELGVSPLRIMELIAGYEDSCMSQPGNGIDTRFELEARPKFTDRIRPKTCRQCGKLFFRGGKKLVSGDLNRPGVTVSYNCSGC